jgi:O-succinylbenzoate synthase
MKIAEMELYRFALPLAKPLDVEGARLTERSGIVIKLSDESGRTGLGEAAPLPGVSIESLQTVESQLLTLRHALSGEKVPDNLEELSGAFDDWLGRFEPAPSVRFGWETAVLNLIAVNRGLPLRAVISDSYRDDVAVNGLLSGTTAEVLDKAERLQQAGYRAVKLKVGRAPLDDEIELVFRVRERLGDAVALRLDANRAWNVDDALNFLGSVAPCGIDYIEEPCRDYNELQTLCRRADLPVPVALDESLAQLSPEELQPLPHLKAVILKPTLLGMERAMRFGRKALFAGIIPVVSSSFESSLGLKALAELAAVLGKDDTPVGLDTLDWLQQDLLREPLSVTGGYVHLTDSVVEPAQLSHDMLREVTYA